MIFYERRIFSKISNLEFKMFLAFSTIPRFLFAGSFKLEYRFRFICSFKILYFFEMLQYIKNTYYLLLLFNKDGLKRLEEAIAKL